MTKILISSAILVALTIGGFVVVAQPNKPNKQDAQSTSTETAAPAIDMTPTGPVTSAIPVTSSDAASPSVDSTATSTAPSTAADSTTPAAAPAPAPPSPQADSSSQTTPLVDTSKPGNHSQTGQTFTVTPLN